jgi:hypothetical protein
MNIKKTWLLGLMALLSFSIISCDKGTTEITTETGETTEQTTSQNTTADTSVTSELTATELLTAAANKVIITGSESLAEDFVLPAEVDGYTVSWASSNVDVINVASTVTATTEGFLQYELTVNQPNQVDGTATVTITGTFYSGDTTYEKVFTVRVPAVDDATIVSTIAAGLALDLGTYITWRDMTVIGIGVDPFWGPTGFFFTDGTDIMYVYNSTFLEDMVIGDVYDIKGGVELYFSIPEVKTIEANTVDVQESTGAVSTLTPTVATISEVIANHEGYDNDNPILSTMYTVTAKVYYDSSLGDYGTYLISPEATTLDRTNAIRIYYKSNMDAVSALDGQIITIDIVLFGNKTSAGDWYAYFLGEAEDISTANMSDADKLAISEAQLESSYDITSSFVLPTLSYGDYSNISISTEISSYLSNSGETFTVVRPSADVTGTLSLTITYNAETVDLTIDITMKELVVTVSGDDIFISQYIEGSSYNKYIEIYNSTDATVDLSEYTLELYTNGAATASKTLTLEGMLASGEVIVVYNNRSDTILYTGDIINTDVINFNGDDAIVLRHNSEVVDSIGQVGVDPGDFWGDATVATQNMTLVRDSSVTGGDTDPFDEYDPSIEWNAFAIDNADDLGEHTQD